MFHKSLLLTTIFVCLLSGCQKKRTTRFDIQPFNDELSNLVNSEDKILRENTEHSFPSEYINGILETSSERLNSFADFEEYLVEINTEGNLAGAQKIVDAYVKNCDYRHPRRCDYFEDFLLRNPLYSSLVVYTYYKSVDVSSFQAMKNSSSTEEYFDQISYAYKVLRLYKNLSDYGSDMGSVLLKDYFSFLEALEGINLEKSTLEEQKQIYVSDLTNLIMTTISNSDLSERKLCDIFESHQSYIVNSQSIHIKNINFFQNASLFCLSFETSKSQLISKIKLQIEEYSQDRSNKERLLSFLKSQSSKGSQKSFIDDKMMGYMRANGSLGYYNTVSGLLIEGATDSTSEAILTEDLSLINYFLILNLINGKDIISLSRFSDNLITLLEIDKNVFFDQFFEDYASHVYLSAFEFYYELSSIEIFTITISSWLTAFKGIRDSGPIAFKDMNSKINSLFSALGPFIETASKIKSIESSLIYHYYYPAQYFVASSLILSDVESVEVKEYYDGLTTSVDTDEILRREIYSQYSLEGGDFIFDNIHSKEADYRQNIVGFQYFMISGIIDYMVGFNRGVSGKAQNVSDFTSELLEKNLESLEFTLKNNKAKFANVLGVTVDPSSSSFISSYEEKKDLILESLYSQTTNIDLKEKIQVCLDYRRFKDPASYSSLSVDFPELADLNYIDLQGTLSLTSHKRISNSKEGIDGIASELQGLFKSNPGLYRGASVEESLRDLSYFVYVFEKYKTDINPGFNFESVSTVRDNIILEIEHLKNNLLPYVIELASCRSDFINLEKEKLQEMYGLARNQCEKTYNSCVSGIEGASSCSLDEFNTMRTDQYDQGHYIYNSGVFEGDSLDSEVSKKLVFTRYGLYLDFKNFLDSSEVTPTRGLKEVSSNDVSKDFFKANQIQLDVSDNLTKSDFIESCLSVYIGAEISSGQKSPFNIESTLDYNRNSWLDSQESTLVSYIDLCSFGECDTYYLDRILNSYKNYIEAHSAEVYGDSYVGVLKSDSMRTLNYNERMKVLLEGDTQVRDGFFDFVFDMVVDRLGYSAEVVADRNRKTRSTEQAALYRQTTGKFRKSFILNQDLYDGSVDFIASYDRDLNNRRMKIVNAFLNYELKNSEEYSYPIIPTDYISYGVFDKFPEKSKACFLEPQNIVCQLTPQTDMSELGNSIEVGHWDSLLAESEIQDLKILLNAIFPRDWKTGPLFEGAEAAGQP